MPREARKYNHNGSQRKQRRDLQKRNPFRDSVQPLLTFDLRFFNLSLPTPPECTITLSATILGNVFEFYAVNIAGNVDEGRGRVNSTYPTTIAQTGSMTGVVDFNTYEFMTATATAVYPYTFGGWYHTAPSGSGGSVFVTASNLLTIYSTTEADLGTNKFYAKFA